MNKIFELIELFNKTKKETWTKKEIIARILQVGKNTDEEEKNGK